MSAIKEKLARNRLRTVSLFSGAGGLDIGAVWAGARIVWANDVKREACDSYALNVGSHIHCGDINSLIPSIRQLCDIDLVIGGPPCQGFSVAGKMDENDERSQLIWSFVSVVEAVSPRAFIMENVKALGTLERWSKVRGELLARFRDLGYAVGFMVLNASDFDVPQSRERIFFVGLKGNSEAVPDLERMIAPYRKKAQTVREALRVLDRAGTGNNRRLCNARITLTAKPVMRKSPYAGMLFNGLGRPIRLDGYCATLPASMGGNKTPIVDEEALYGNREPWVETYHKRLLADPSIAAFQQAPPFLRRLTVDEARVIQTFPLDYEFCGSQSAQYAQIGNAVPCNLAKAVCSMVIDVLEGHAPVVFSGLFDLI